SVSGLISYRAHLIDECQSNPELLLTKTIRQICRADRCSTSQEHGLAISTSFVEGELSGEVLRDIRRNNGDGFSARRMILPEPVTEGVLGAMMAYLDEMSG